jgi:hypothetical protein
MCVRIYLDLHTSRTQIELTIQFIGFADFTHNSMANYLHTMISRICCSRRCRHNVIDFLLMLSILWWPVFGIRKFSGLMDPDPSSEVRTDPPIQKP